MRDRTRHLLGGGAGPVIIVTLAPGETSGAPSLRALRGCIQRLVEHPREARDHHFGGTGPLERGNARTAGRAAGKHIVDQHHIRALRAVFLAELTASVPDSARARDLRPSPPSTGVALVRTRPSTNTVPPRSFAISRASSAA